MTAVNPVETVVYLAPEIAADFSDILVVRVPPVVVPSHRTFVLNRHSPDSRRFQPHPASFPLS
jgi:hypothetical protein